MQNVREFKRDLNKTLYKLKATLLLFTTRSIEVFNQKSSGRRRRIVVTVSLFEAKKIFRNSIEARQLFVKI